MLPVKDFQLRSLNADSRLDGLCWLDIDSKPLPFRQSSIVCTLGPSSREVPKIVQMIKAGMNIARLNFSHGTHEYHLGTINNVREAAKIVGQEYNIATYPIAIALDTKGPEIRTGNLEGGGTGEVELVKGRTVKLTTNDEYKDKCSAAIVHLDYKNITKVVPKDSFIYIDDGLISLKAVEVGPDYIICNIENGGLLGSKKGVNLPGAYVDLPAVSEKDKQDLVFGCQNQVDMVFASFIRNADGVKEIRNILKSMNNENVKIISKIENYEGVKKTDEIIRESDGIMVARGDMGIEIPPHKVFLAQKMMIAKCNIAGKPVICATQMLESMTKKPRPTRAEVSDVANAIWDGADCVMLSGETAKGEYVLDCVNCMSSIVLEAEASIPTKLLFNELTAKTMLPSDVTTAMAAATVDASLKSNIVAIFVLTTTGISAHVISKFRPRCPIVTITGDAKIARQANLFRGLVPFVSPEDWAKTDSEQHLKAGIQFAKQMNICKTGDNIIVVTGLATNSVSSMRISVVE